MRIFEITLFSNFKAPCSVFYVLYFHSVVNEISQCVILLPTEEMYKTSIKYYYTWPQKRIQILLLNFFSLRTFYLYLYCKAVCLSVVVKVIPFFFHCRFVVYPEVKNRGSHLLSYLHTYPIFSFWTNLQII